MCGSSTDSQFAPSAKAALAHIAASGVDHNLADSSPALRAAHAAAFAQASHEEQLTAAAQLTNGISSPGLQPH